MLINVYVKNCWLAYSINIFTREIKQMKIKMVSPPYIQREKKKTYLYTCRIYEICNKKKIWMVSISICWTCSAICMKLKQYFEWMIWDRDMHKWSCNMAVYSALSFLFLLSFNAEDFNVVEEKGSVRKKKINRTIEYIHFLINNRTEESNWSHPPDFRWKRPTLT